MRHDADVEDADVDDDDDDVEDDGDFDDDAVEDIVFDHDVEFDDYLDIEYDVHSTVDDCVLASSLDAMLAHLRRHVGALDQSLAQSWALRYSTLGTQVAHLGAFAALSVAPQMSHDL